ncbi:MAG: MFS transporter [Methylococcales bacterium]|nr:MFS transporter [Methylococcales bacterium]|tara:strand:+ start:154 stop:1464 length:1311 start_codon:yes stop_codon:yes gene_type:complete
MRLLRQSNSIYRGWWLAGLGAVVMALGTVPLFQGMPVWNPVLRNAFGWTAGQMSWAFAVTRIEGGLLGPLEGLLIERLGPRRMVAIGLPILGAGFIFLSQTSELWHLYASFGIMSFGAALGGWLPMMTVMNHWFVRKKTRAMAVVMEGFAVGGIGIPFLLAWCIGGADPNISERFGWSTTALGVGVTIIVFALPLAWLVRNRPEEVGLRPDGDKDDGSEDLTGSNPPETPKIEPVGYSWQLAIRTRTFWLISLGHACSSIVIVTIMVHLGLLLDDRGYSLPTISAIVGTYTGVNAIFILIGGYLGDRVPIRYAAFGFSAIQSIAVVILIFNDGIGMAYLFAVILGIGFGGRTPVTTSIRGVYFGRKAFAAITGMSMVPMNVMLFAAPLFAGYMRDSTGSYTIPFLTIAIVCMLGSCLFLLLGNPPTFLEPDRSSQQ